MTDIDAIDALNTCIRFDGAGRVVWMDDPRARTHLARMTHRPIAEELARCLSRRDFSRNRLLAYADTGAPRGLVAGVMSTPYVKDSDDRRVVSLHAFSFRDLDTLAPLQAAFPAPDVRPVAVDAATARIRDTLRFVAFFPDSLIGELPDGYADGFYFCAKFVEAFETRIRPLLARLWAPGAFATLRAASGAQLHRAAAIWVHLHEYHHCHSVLPIAAYPVLKGTRLSGAFEELRVDLNAMLTDVAAVLDPDTARLVFEFILAFRLIHYGSSFDPERDYDAITSVALANALLEQGSIRATGGLFDLAPRADLAGGLRAALTALTRAEETLALRLEPRADRDRQRAARGVFEDLMRGLCRAGPEGHVARGSFHTRHAAALETEAFAAG